VKTAKLLLSSVVLVIFSGAMLGCESDGSDHETRTTTTTTHDDGTTYKKTTYTDSNGNNTVKTEKTTRY